MSEFSSLVLTSENVLLPGKNVPLPATIRINLTTGKIVGVLDGVYEIGNIPGCEGAQHIDYGKKFILPGLVDAHVHLNEPGRTDWEGFWTGTRAAASGGVTTVVDMPLNSIPPTTTVENLAAKRQAAEGQCWVDVGFWGGVIPGNEKNLKPLVDAGVKGFKCFLIESGVEEFPCVDEGALRKAMPELQGEPTVLAFHAEFETEPSLPSTGDPTQYSTFLESRPESLETAAISLIIRLQQSYPDLRCHIVHLSASSALSLVRAAKSAGAKLTAETCFHYLALAADLIPVGKPEFKCCPPIRDDANRDALWAGLLDGTLDFVVSDHSPCVEELKCCSEGDIMKAWGGISTLGLGLSVLWTEGRKRGASIGKIVEWTSVNTAKHASLSEVKGKIEVGYDADFVVWDPEAEFKVTKGLLNFKNKLSPYEGLTLTGVVERTYLRGQLVYDKDVNGLFCAQPLGKLL